MSFDFLVESGEAFLIEINPRPGATLDIFDDAMGTLFSAHIEGFSKDGDPAAILAAQWAPPLACAAAYLYADRGTIEITDVVWPDWVRDRPRTGAKIARHQPIATVIAEGETTEGAEARCREHLRNLEDMLYGKAAGKERY